MTLIHKQLDAPGMGHLRPAAAELRLAGEAGAFVFDSLEPQIFSPYDAASNRASYTAPGGSTNTHTYDTLNRLSNLTNSSDSSFGSPTTHERTPHSELHFR